VSVGERETEARRFSLAIIEFTIDSKFYYYFDLPSTVVIKANNGDGKGVISSFAYTLLPVFHELGKGFETLRIMKDAFRVCFAKDVSFPLEKHKWPNLSACHAGYLIEFLLRYSRIINR
jgi:hypothetical protein